MSRRPLPIAIALAVAALLSCKPGATPTARPGPTPPAPPAPLVPTAPPPEGLRLPDHVVPTAYTLDIEVDPAVVAFSGRVAIDLDVREPISSLWLNARRLAIHRARITAAGRALDAEVLEAPEDSELLGLDFGGNVPVGAALLEIEFSGRKRQRVGLFRQQQNARWYAYTDFEPSDARRAFPCFDDPRFKVPWTVSLVVPRDHEAFANTPRVGEEKLDGDRKRVRFAPTRPLPSYLVAFAAGPFDVVEGATEPAPLRVIVPRGRGADASYALDAAPELLAILADYFDAPMPYRKVDLISVPRMDGAMENPGLITIGARILLLDPDTATDEQHRLLALVIAHELAHLWFGDSVTLAWWDDLWLNEGFATWMADKALARWKPAWRWQLEAVAAKLDAMQVDSNQDARAIRQPIETAADIRASFGAITYKKGGAVLAMFESWLGEPTFRAGVRAYVRDHADGTATASDLLAALSAAAGRDVATPFRSFLDRAGLPEVGASLRCADGAVRVDVTQRRYRAIGDEPPAAGPTEPWQIPICIRHPEGRDCALLDSAAETIELSAERCPVWIHPNAGEAGYYRYALPGDELTALARHGASTLDTAERVGLVANIRAGLRGGSLDVATAAQALRALASSDSVPVAEGIVATIADLRVTVTGASARRGYARFVRALFGKRARRLGFEPRRGESDADHRLRPILVDFVADDGEDRQLRARARRLARAFFDDRTAVHPSMQDVVLGLAALDGDAALFDRMVAALAGTEIAEQREALLYGIASFADPALTRRALDLARDELGRRDGLGMMRTILQNPRTRDAGFAYFRAHYDGVMKRVPGPARRYMPYVTAGFCSVERAEQVEAFFHTKLETDDPARDIVELAVAQILRCDAFRAHHRADAEGLFD